MDILSAVLSAGGVVALMGLLYGFSNGFRDSSTIVATVVSTRALTANKAFFMCAIGEFCGAMFIGTAVALTMSKGMFQHALENANGEIILVLGSGIGAAIVWGVVSWWRIWPTSNSQALVAGLAGASFVMWGKDHFANMTHVRVLLVLVASPVLGLVIASFLTAFIRFIGAWLTPKIKPTVERLHVLSCFFVSCANGSNDGQIIMGVGLLALGFFSPSAIGGEIPTGVRLIVALSIGCGVLLGGRRILKRMGMKFYRIKPTQGLGAQLTSAGTIFSCAMAGFPASTMQVITGSIVGAGVAKNARAIRWDGVSNICLSWVLTLPSVALLGAFLCQVVLLVSR